MTQNKTKLEKKADRVEIMLYSLAAAIVIIFSMLIFGLRQNQQAINQSHQAICAEKLTYQQQIKSTKSFLRDHPKGIPGVPNKLLLQGLQETEAQLAALHNISCS